jgi:hypothetical protein
VQKTGKILSKFSFGTPGAAFLRSMSNFLEELCPTAATETIGDLKNSGLIGTIVAHAFLEEAIIRRLEGAIAAKDKEAVWNLAVELVATHNG